ncbi:hypothetical protein B0T14DRAFT_500464 [Immersiella caudata]|uniref:RNase H type-1 domain-containing protein n=1 Tax=Immersiella caudata TaxID=314043 RepID=A0AA39U594_9PEZI|nr:hypothetical protein B0T14DRAFT_500464 [Immersiella caudata]
METYDKSEDEDNPRRVLDVTGDFTQGNADPPVTFNLRNRPSTIPVAAIRPVPDPELVRRVEAAMGNGENNAWAGTIFGEPYQGPGHVFCPRSVNTAYPGVEFERYVLRRRRVPQNGGLKTMKLLISGRCVDKGKPNARGGWAVVYKPGPNSVVTGVLERLSIDGQPYMPSDNWAELRPAVAALECRLWYIEGWERIVVSTSSDYVANGAAMWIQT